MDTILNIYKKSFDLIQANLLELTTLALINIILSIPSNYILPSLSPSTLLYINLYNIFIYSPIILTLNIFCYYRMINGVKPVFDKESINQIKGKYLYIILAMIIFLIIFMVPIIFMKLIALFMFGNQAPTMGTLFIITGLILAIIIYYKLIFLFHNVVLRDAKPFAAIKRSLDLTSGKIPTLLGAVIPLIVVMAIVIAIINNIAIISGISKLISIFLSVFMGIVITKLFLWAEDEDSKSPVVSNQQ